MDEKWMYLLLGAAAMYLYEASTCSCNTNPQPGNPNFVGPVQSTVGSCPAGTVYDPALQGCLSSVQNY